jgi:hypothetical protein
MSETQPTGSVRPIPARSDPGAPNRTPRLAVAIALLAAGTLGGWLVGSARGDPTLPSTESSVAAASSVTTEPPAVVSWHEAQSIPPLPAGLSLSGGYDAAELDGDIYLAVNLTDGSDTAGAMLWRSTDGVTWDDVGIDLGGSVAISRVLPYGEGLLLVGTRTEQQAAAERPGATIVWRSLPGRSIDADSWVEVALDSPGVSPYYVTAAVNDSGYITVVAEGSIDLTAAVVDPLLPPGFSATDPDVFAQGSAVVVDADTTDGRVDVIAQFAAMPELTVVGNRAWSRVVGLDGAETMASYPLPATGHYQDGPQQFLRVATTTAWASEDGIEFRPVTGAIPDGFFIAEHRKDRFVAAAYDRQASFAPNENITVWESRRGNTWHPAQEQPPSRCSPFFFAAGGSRLLALSETGPICIRDGNADWVVLGGDRPPAGSLVGGDAGFALFPFDTQIAPPQFSPDGVNWTELEIPEDSVHPQIVVLGDRLLLTAVYVAPASPPEPRIWVGDLD